MVRFTDRRREMETLTEAFSTLRKGELVLVYGRRRVGKTELMRKFLKKISKEQGLYLYVHEGTPATQLRSLAEDVKREWTNENPVFETWDSLYDFLEKKTKERGKLVVVIDEFQRLHADPQSLTKLQRAWDERFKNLPIMIILQGSSIGMISKIAQNSRAPLFGRRTKEMRLDPFDYQAFREALKHAKLSEEQKIDLYATFGGIPAYLDIAEAVAEKGYDEVIAEAFLNKNGRLHDEPQRLLSSELRETPRYWSILSAIAEGKETPKEIGDITHLSAPALQSYARRLKDLLSIVALKEPVLGKKKSTRYLIADNLFRFWFRFIGKNATVLELENYESVRKVILAELPMLTALVFEEVVIELVRKLTGKQWVSMPINVEALGSWWDRKGEQIDVCGHADNVLLLGEVKWRNEPTDIDVARELLRKKAYMTRGTKLEQYKHVLFIVSKSGFTESASTFMIEHAMHAFDLQDVTKAYDALPQK